MKLRRPVRLGVEQLEERCTPAINAFLDSTGLLRIMGTLDNTSGLVSPPSRALNIVATAPGTFTISDGVPTLSSPTISGVNSISITLGATALPNEVFVDLSLGNLPGNLTVDTGSHSQDFLQILGVGAGDIGGSVQVRSVESVDFTLVGISGNVSVTNSGTVVPTGVAFALATITGSVSVTGGYAGDAVGLGGGVSIGGNLSVNLGTSNFGIGNDQFNMSTTDVVNGFLSVSSGNGVGTTISFDGTVNGSASFRLGNGVNVFDFFSTGMVGGSLTVTSGNGSFSDGGGGGFAGTVGGNVTISLGSGTNNVLLDGIFLGQSVNVIAKAGTNTVTLGASLMIPSGRLFIYLAPGGVNTFIDNSAGGFPITLYS